MPTAGSRIREQAPPGCADAIGDESCRCLKEGNVMVKGTLVHYSPNQPLRKQESGGVIRFLKV